MSDFLLDLDLRAKFHKSVFAASDHLDLYFIKVAANIASEPIVDIYNLSLISGKAVCASSLF